MHEPTTTYSTTQVSLPNKHRVLIVEDSEFVHQIYRVAFRKLGSCELVHANHGLEGLAALEASGPVELIIVDINMPVMDGLAFIRELRRRSLHKDTHVLVASTELQQGHVKDAMSLGPSSFLRKPFNLAQLMDQLGALIGMPAEKAFS